MALLDKLRQELDRAGRSAQRALDEGRLRLDLFRARQSVDRFAQRFGYAVFRAKKAGAASLEGCMASSITQARNGTLYLMTAGDEKVYERVKPILSKLSDDGHLMTYIGKAGKAAQVKALVNMVMNINTAGLAEGLGLGAAHGLDVSMLREVFSQTGANSRVLQTDGEDMQNREHSCFFSAAHAAKDSGIALGLAKDKKLEMPLATATFKQFSKMTKEGLGELDKSGIAELTFKGRHKSKKKK